MWSGCRPPGRRKGDESPLPARFHWFSDQTIRQVFLSEILQPCQDIFFNCSTLIVAFFSANVISMEEGFSCPRGSEKSDAIGRSFISFPCFFQKNFGSDRIEDATFTTFGHDRGCFPRGQPSEFHIFDHFSDEVKGDHAMAAHRIKF